MYFTYTLFEIVRSLQITMLVRFYTEPSKMTMEVKRHFSTLRSDTNCAIQVRPYEAVRKDLEQIVQGIQDDSMVWVSNHSSEAVNNVVPEVLHIRE